MWILATNAIAISVWNNSKWWLEYILFILSPSKTASRIIWCLLYSIGSLNMLWISVYKDSFVFCGGDDGRARGLGTTNVACLRLSVRQRFTISISTVVSTMTSALVTTTRGDKLARRNQLGFSDTTTLLLTGFYTASKTLTLPLKWLSICQDQAALNVALKK